MDQIFIYLDEKDGRIREKEEVLYKFLILPRNLHTIEKTMNKFDKVIVIMNDKEELIAIQFHDMKKKSVITYNVTEVGMDESLALLNKISGKEYEVRPAALSEIGIE